MRGLGLCQTRASVVAVFSDLDVGACIFQERKCAYRDRHASFESTQNKQQYGPKITCTEEKKKNRDF